MGCDLPFRLYEQNLAMIRALCQVLNTLEGFKMDFARITESVARLETVGDSAIALLEGLSAEVRRLADLVVTPEDAATIEALADKIDAETDKLVAAVVANTPAAPEPPAPPVEEPPAEAPAETPAEG